MANIVNNTQTENKIRDLEPFSNRTRTLHGIPGTFTGLGKLPETYHTDVREALYVVYSYGTPIAWVREDGTKVIPDVGYSPSTGQHQYIVKAAWNMPSHPVRGREVVSAGGGPRRGGIDDL